MEVDVYIRAAWMLVLAAELHTHTHTHTQPGAI